MNLFKRLMILTSLVAALTMQSAFAESFADINEGEIYKTGIEFLQAEGIVDGYPDGTFQPDRVLNRAEMLKMVIEAKARYEGEPIADLDDYADDECFNDVPANEWYTKYVCYAKEQGWVEGYENGTMFRPAATVNFVEAVKITLEVFGIEYEATDDVWYRGLIERAGMENYLPHNITAFDEGLKRNQMADLITRIIKAKEDKLDEYLGYRATYVVNYETILEGRNLAREAGDEVGDDDTSGDDTSGNDTYRNMLEKGDINFDPLSTPVISVFILTSEEDSDRVFTVIEVKEDDMDKEPASDDRLHFLGMGPDVGGDGNSAFYYLSSADCDYLGGCSDALTSKKATIAAEATTIATTFSFDGSGTSDLGCSFISNFDFSLQFPETWGNLDEFAILDEEYWGTLSTYIGGPHACSMIDGQYPEDNSGDDAVDDIFAQWRAEVEAEYDLESCKAYDFPNLMMGKIATIYTYCQELYADEEAARRAEFEVFKDEIDGMIENDLTISQDLHDEYQAVLLQYKEDWTITANEYWDYYSKIESIPVEAQ